MNINSILHCRNELKNSNKYFPNYTYISVRVYLLLYCIALRCEFSNEAPTTHSKRRSRLATGGNWSYKNMKQIYSQLTILHFNEKNCSNWSYNESYLHQNSRWSVDYTFFFSNSISLYCMFLFLQLERWPARSVTWQLSLGNNFCVALFHMLCFNFHRRI